MNSDEYAETVKRYLPHAAALAVGFVLGEVAPPLLRNAVVTGGLLLALALIVQGLRNRGVIPI